MSGRVRCSLIEGFEACVVLCFDEVHRPSNVECRRYGVDLLRDLVDLVEFC